MGESGGAGVGELHSGEQWVIGAGLLLYNEPFGRGAHRRDLPMYISTRKVRGDIYFLHTGISYVRNDAITTLGCVFFPPSTAANLTLRDIRNQRGGCQIGVGGYDFFSFLFLISFRRGLLFAQSMFIHGAVAAFTPR